MLPHHVELAIAGKTLRTATRTDAAINPDFRADAFALPEEPRTEVDEAAAKRGGVSSQYVTQWHAMGLPFGDLDQTSVTATAVADDPDVQYLTGGTHHSLAINLGEGIVVLAHQPLPAPFADWARGLLDGLATLDWEIEWIAGGHGGVAPFTDLLSHFES